ncbi:hypothetical protein TRIUR3_20000 [Triticum urartu]|uniref:Uncharacterized protein n=1 Tax=Triticum urartu TaxID=4572 RepID=M7YVZ6_TRIUA|nr:hypothetical protein TRIUR3_20000 [Triticum urartu]
MGLGTCIGFAAHSHIPINPQARKMKIFSWMANKISGKQEASRFPASSSGPSRSNMPDCRNDEFSDWPQSLLAIGTFGNKQIEEVAQVQDTSEDGQSMQDAIKFTEEEVDRIQKEFAMILASKDQAEAHDSHDDEQLLKAILQKKIHPQNSSTLVPRRHLDWKPDEQEINECLEDALRDLDDDGAKWVKTDSDCSKDLGKLGIRGVMIYIEVWDIVINEATNYDAMPLCFSHKSFVIGLLGL